MSISANTVKELREKTNAGMMDCKKALEEAAGNMEKAIEILRKRGLALAQKKSGRAAKEGILGNYYDASGNMACLVEVNCETDFVVKTADFQNFVAAVTKIVQKESPKDLEALLAAKYDGKQSVQETLTALIAKIGENIHVRQFVRWETQNPKEVLGFYLHAGSKIGVLILIQDETGKIKPPAAKEVAMHIAAMHPQYIRPGDIPPAVLEKEKEILRSGVDAKKPPQIQEKILEGKLEKFYNDVCLENQIFVKDLEGKKSVKDWLAMQSGAAKIQKFVRLQVGA